MCTYTWLLVWFSLVVCCWVLEAGNRELGNSRKAQLVFETGSNKIQSSVTLPSVRKRKETFKLLRKTKWSPCNSLNMSSVLCVLELVSDRRCWRRKRKALGFSVSLCWLNVPQRRRTKTFRNVKGFKLLPRVPKIVKGIVLGEIRLFVVFPSVKWDQ